MNVAPLTQVIERYLFGLSDEELGKTTAKVVYELVEAKGREEERRKKKKGLAIFNLDSPLKKEGLSTEQKEQVKEVLKEVFGRRMEEGQDKEAKKRKKEEEEEEEDDDDDDDDFSKTGEEAKRELQKRKVEKIMSKNRANDDSDEDLTVKPTKARKMKAKKEEEEDGKESKLRAILKAYGIIYRVGKEEKEKLSSKDHCDRMERLLKSKGLDIHSRISKKDVERYQAKKELEQLGGVILESRTRRAAATSKTVGRDDDRESESDDDDDDDDDGDGDGDGDGGGDGDGDD